MIFLIGGCQSALERFQILELRIFERRGIGRFGGLAKNGKNKKEEGAEGGWFHAWNRPPTSKKVGAEMSIFPAVQLGIFITDRES
jgi:hypothetical protein